MNRKDIIIVSVLVNAGLLVILFISAILSRGDATSEAEKGVVKASEMPISPGVVNVEEKNFQGTEVAVQNPGRRKFPLASEAGKTFENGESAQNLPENFLTAENQAKEAIAQGEIVHSLPSLEQGQEVFLNPEEEAPRVKEIFVKKGDTLEKIARTHGTTIAKLRELNCLGKYLRIHQKLIVPVSGKTPSKNILKDSSQHFYTVRPGDNPSTIALKHRMKVEELLRLNHLDQAKARKLKPGDKLRVR